jgi:hypothetical protein
MTISQFTFIPESAGLAPGLQELANAVMRGPHTVVHFVEEGPEGQPGWFIASAEYDPDLVEQFMGAASRPG